MALAQEIAERLLLAKGLLETIRSVPTASPDRLTLAKHVLTAHDAAELALASIAHHLNMLPKDKAFLMDYVAEIRKGHSGKAVPGQGYFDQLNQVRVGLKHKGIIPNTEQWYRVGEKTYAHLSDCCNEYLKISLDDLDESALISNPTVKKHFDSAREAFSRRDYQGVLEKLAIAMETLFDSNQALRKMAVGSPRAEDAIKLSAFGVHANDFLALQEFLPQVITERFRGESGEHNVLHVKWDQKSFGHPGNWRTDSAEFCLGTFLSVALRIQDAECIPGAIDFNFVYEHKITAIMDEVEIFESHSGLFSGIFNRVVLRKLNKGDSIRGFVSPTTVTVSASTNLAYAGLIKPEPTNSLIDKPSETLQIVRFNEKFFGEVEAKKVRVTCVPREDPFVQKYFPDLPEIEYKP